jgi:hypothetical protein
MATRVLGPTGSRRRRRFLFVSLLLVACTALVLAGSAQAVHEFSLQLDGDVSTHAYTVPNTNPPLDWGANTCNVADTPVPPGPACPTGVAGQTDLAHSIFNVVRPDPATCNSATPPVCTANTEGVIANSTNVGAAKAFDAASFQRDFRSGANCTLNSTSTTRCNNDTTTYSTGSKDTLGIADGGWQCGNSQNVNNKVDINNAYVASFWTGGSAGSGDHILYAGVEKEKNNGTNDIGVWFLQGSASCSSTGANINWSGSGHRNGDVLLVSEFSNGGGVSTVKTFTWRASTDPSSPFFGDGGCIDSRSGHFNPAVDGGCNGLQSGGGGDCKRAGVNDTTCATTNAQFRVDPVTGKSVPADPYANRVSTPWLSSDATLGVGNDQVVSPDFIEMGIDITKLFAGTGEAAPSCFSTGVPDTRSSPSITATLFDYTVNTIGGCGSSTVTTPKDGSGTNIPSTGLSIGTQASGTSAAVQVKDHAVITVTGFTGNFAGTVTFFLCGPLDPSVTTTNCNDTDPAAGGDTHGVQIGSPVTVSGSNGSASVDSSDAYSPARNTVLTSVGRYCWRAVYSGDGDVPPSADPAKTSTSTSECFKVTPVTPTLTTSATCSAAPCVLGSTLNDTASLTGTAKKPGTNGIGAATAWASSAAGTIDATDQSLADSSISWQVFAPNSSNAAQCTTAIANQPTPSSVLVSGDKPTAALPNARYGPVSYTTLSTDRVGPYEFAASYGPDSPNTLAATGSGASCDTTGANNEQVTVIGTASSASKQGWLPNDRITLTSTAGTTMNGNLTVTLYYGALATGSTLANCTLATGAVQKFQETWSSAAGADHPAVSGNPINVNTHNTSFFVGVDPSTGNPSTPAGPDSASGNDYFWLIHFVDNSLTSPNDRCEKTTITHTD